MPFNLYYTPDGKTALRYLLRGGAFRERIVPFPAALLTAPPDPEAAVCPRTLLTPREALFSAFRMIPLSPDGAWKLAETGFSPVFRRAFDLLLRMLRMPPERRWCTRGEPEWFLQFGLHDEEMWEMAALVLPCGKPAALTFRAEDFFRALGPAAKDRPFALLSVSDGAPKETVHGVGSDIRIRLPVDDNGGAIVRFVPEQ